MQVEHSELGRRWCYADQAVPLLVTGNETNNERVFGTANDVPYVKDGVDRAVVLGETAAVDPSGEGTKAAFHYRMRVAGNDSATIRLRLTETKYESQDPAEPFADFDAVVSARRDEADQFWTDILTGELTADDRLTVRQALAGMLSSKQYYIYDVERWLAEHGLDPLGASSSNRNYDWRHLIAEDIISMPDKWEYPWFASWDLAFHAIVRTSPHWQDLLLFYEYFNGDNGSGVGASHQTGWTGAVALLPLLFRGTAGQWVRTRRGVWPRTG